MSIELRTLSLVTLAIGALPALASGSTALALAALTALAIAAVGLIPPAPPMVNGLAAFIAGGLLAFAGVAAGSLGVAAALVTPLAMASLRLGWRAVVWSTVAAAAIALAVGATWMASPVAVAAVALTVTGWALAHNGLNRGAAAPHAVAVRLRSVTAASGIHAVQA